MERKMSSFDMFLAEWNEPLTYAVFFGGLILFGVLESRFELREAGASRKRRWPVNFALTVLNILVLGAIPVTALVAAEWAEEGGHGWLNQREHSFALLLIVGFLARSLTSWAVHWAMHNVPVLWRVHRVHHTDTHMDISTAVRMHPIEFVLTAPVVVAVVAGLGLPPEVVILYELFDTGMAIFTHANIRLPNAVERVLRLFVVTPNLHRIHHSTLVPETNSNYGATLSVWDRAFGTYRQKDEAGLRVQRLGLEETQDARASSFFYLATLPFRPTRILPVNEVRDHPSEDRTE
jgi:sterol desaturase/sphingolipid hydroxylase (fatty acid hydroxylase superfamily)